MSRTANYFPSLMLKHEFVSTGLSGIRAEQIVEQEYTCRVSCLFLFGEDKLAHNFVDT